MIAALRPNDANYDETISTLRYASNAKLIQNKSKVNTSDPKVLVKKLQQQVEDLKAALKAGGRGGPDPEAEQKMREAEERMEEMRRSFDEQLRQVCAACDMCDIR